MRGVQPALIVSALRVIEARYVPLRKRFIAAGHLIESFAAECDVR
jgi:hypothetical protein